MPEMHERQPSSVAAESGSNNADQTVATFVAGIPVQCPIMCNFHKVLTREDQSKKGDLMGKYRV
jgi:hypothetical protein